MTSGHRGHLCASLSSLEEAVRDMTEVGRGGRSPTNGQRLTPLPKQEWVSVAAALRRAEGRLTEAVRTLAPACLVEREQAEGLGGTLFRLAILLRNIEEGIVGDLDPSRMEARFGVLSEHERVLLARLKEGMCSDLSEVRERLDGLRAP